MRYALNVNRMVNQLVPYYIGGRRLILYLQSVMGPLQDLADAFTAYAKETRIEASMTSQIFKFEWFLNRKFGKYLADSSKRISITNGGQNGTVVYNESAEAISDEDHLKLYFSYGENSDPDRKQAVFYRVDEKIENAQYSFVVNSPAVNKEALLTAGDLASLDATQQKAKAEEIFKGMLGAVIERYRLAGKTYTITIN